MFFIGPNEKQHKSAIECANAVLLPSVFVHMQNSQKRLNQK